MFLSCIITLSIAFSCYMITMPFVVVGDKIVMTESENAIFSHYVAYSWGYDFELPYEDVQDTSNIESKDLKMLKYMKNLKRLDIVANPVDDLTKIGKLTQLEQLCIGGGDMNAKPSDYSPLSNLNNLHAFGGINLTGFNNFKAFENMPDLQFLSLTFVEIKPEDLEYICSNKKLTYLNLYACALTDCSAIGKCSELTYLSLSDTNVNDISYLENLKNLETLDIDNIPIKDCSALSSLTNLNELDMSSTKVTDLSYLGKLTNLERLSIENIDAEDYSFLLSLSKLKYLDISNNQVPDDIIKSLKHQNSDIDINYSYE